MAERTYPSIFSKWVGVKLTPTHKAVFTTVLETFEEHNLKVPNALRDTVEKLKGSDDKAEVVIEREYRIDLLDCLDTVRPKVDKTAKGRLDRLKPDLSTPLYAYYECDLEGYSRTKIMHEAVDDKDVVRGVLISCHQSIEVRKFPKLLGYDTDVLVDSMLCRSPGGVWEFMPHLIEDGWWKVPPVIIQPTPSSEVETQTESKTKTEKETEKKTEANLPPPVPPKPKVVPVFGESSATPQETSEPPVQTPVQTQTPILDTPASVKKAKGRPKVDKFTDGSGYLYIWHPKVTDRCKVGFTKEKLMDSVAQENYFIKRYGTGCGKGIHYVIHVQNVVRAEKELLSVLKPYLLATTEQEERNVEILPIEHVELVKSIITMIGRVSQWC